MSFYVFLNVLYAKGKFIMIVIWKTTFEKLKTDFYTGIIDYTVNIGLEFEPQTFHIPLKSEL